MHTIFSRVIAYLLLILGGFLSACREEPIVIPNLSVGARTVLVEELTGVRCGNCPDGTKDLVELKKRFGNRLVIVAVHAAPGFDVPYSESKEDFRTAKGTQLANFIGQAAFYPCAAVNRRLVSGEPERYLPRSIWAGIVAEELAKPPAAGLVLNHTYNADTRRLHVEVRVLPERTLSEPHRLTVAITQDSIQDMQNVVTTKTPNYQHRYALRELLTAPTGDDLNEPLNAATTVTRTFSTLLPINWEAKRCRVVAFLHKNTATDKEIVQAAEINVLK